MRRKKKNPRLWLGLVVILLGLTAWGQWVAPYVSANPDQTEQAAPDQTEVFISQIGEEARKLSQAYDLYASVMIAQAVLESQSSQSRLATAPNYNLFGMKGSYEGQSVVLPTQEDDGTGNLHTIDAAFRSYPSYRESLIDYAQVLQQEHFWGAHKSMTTSYQEATQALTGVYATDTHYAEKLDALISQYQLTQYDTP